MQWGTVSLTNPTVASDSHGSITLNAPANAGFCHFSVTVSDGTTKGGWLVVGNPAASLAKTTGDGQTGILSTSTPARSSRVEQTVFRRRTCDKGIWTKPLAFAVDAGFAMGFPSIFAWKALSEAGFAEKSSYGSMLS